MKRTIIAAIFSLLFASAFAEGITIYAPVAQDMLIDEKDFSRYSPLNAFDGKSSTVYAVPYDKISAQIPLMTINFAEPARFDKITIKAGYYDKKYFSKNNRIKKLSLQIMNCRNIDYDKSAFLVDAMVEQAIYSGKPMTSTQLSLYVNDIFPGEKWNDLVISDIEFYLDGRKQNVTFGKGQCIFGEIYHNYKYDDQDRLVSTWSQFGHASCSAKHFKYEDGKIYCAIENMEDDPANLSFFEVESVDEKTTEEKLFQKNFQVFYSGNLIIGEKFKKGNDTSFYINQYIYDKNNVLSCIIRICENENWSDKYTDFEYNDKGLLIKKISYEDATIYKERYE